jgi:hypothetical protein
MAAGTRPQARVDANQHELEAGPQIVRDVLEHVSILAEAAGAVNAAS